MGNIIELNDLCFEYEEGKHTIDHIHLNIPRGKKTAILGHNGSGKSTITKLLIGLLPASKGDIIVDGITLSEKTLYDVRDKIGIVFQNPDNQFIGSTVRDDIAFGLENKCVDPTLMEGIIVEYARKVGMQDFLDSEPSKLSGGQKQRVAIAGILATKPSIIILDEATSMLDPKGRNEINSLIDEISKKENITIVSITHDIEDAVNYDHIVLLKDGQVKKVGTPEAILSDVRLLQDTNLDVPFIYRVTSQLQQKGLEIDPTISTGKAVNDLCQLLLKK